METHTYIITDSDQGVYIVIPLEEYRQLQELLNYLPANSEHSQFDEPQKFPEPSYAPYTPVTIL